MKNRPIFFALSPYNQIIEIKASSIHGLGIFSKKKLPKNYVLGPAMVDKSLAERYAENLTGNYNNPGVDDNWVQVIGTRYLNHSSQPNIRFEFQDKIIMAITVKEIAVGEEITVDYTDYFSHTVVPFPEFLREKKAA